MTADRCTWPGCNRVANERGRRLRDGRLCLGHTLDAQDLEYEARISTQGETS